MKKFRKNKLALRIACLFVAMSFLSSACLPSYARAQDLVLPSPSQFVNLSNSYSFPVLKGMKFDPNNPLQMEFIIDTADQKKVSEEEASRLIKYFLAGLTIPDDQLWVNMSPYEKDNMITQALSETDLGKDLLSQDYILKQLSSSLTYPESGTGKDFWQKTYEEVLKIAKTTKLPVNTFNKIWIIPEKAEVYENGSIAVVAEASLKTMLEEDYLALKNNVADIQKQKKNMQEDLINKVNEASSKVMREQIIPKINAEVNSGKNFATLRQVYYSLIMAAWFKNKFRDSIYKHYINQGKVAGIDLNDKDAKDKIYNLYVEAFKKGVYNYIKSDYDPGLKRNIKRQYFSGGMVLPMGSAIAVRPASGAAINNAATTLNNRLGGPLEMMSIRLEPQGQAGSPVELDPRILKRNLEELIAIGQYSNKDYRSGQWASTQHVVQVEFTDSVIGVVISENNLPFPRENSHTQRLNEWVIRINEKHIKTAEDLLDQILANKNFTKVFDPVKIQRAVLYKGSSPMEAISPRVVSPKLKELLLGMGEDSLKHNGDGIFERLKKFDYKDLKVAHTVIYPNRYVFVKKGLPLQVATKVAKLQFDLISKCCKSAGSPMTIEKELRELMNSYTLNPQKALKSIGDLFVFIESDENRTTLEQLNQVLSSLEEIKGSSDNKNLKDFIPNYIEQVKIIIEAKKVKYLNLAETEIRSYLEKQFSERKISEEIFNKSMAVAYKNLKFWATDESIGKLSPKTQVAIFEAIQQGRWKDIVEVFRQDITFGCAGIRGKAALTLEELLRLKEEGPSAKILKGPNTINDIVLLRYTTGVIEYAKQKGKHKVIIGYDSRIDGQQFAEMIAECFIGKSTPEHEFTVYLFDEASPFPELSFGLTTEYVRADMGILISASHNPSEYNGYKITDSKGAQIPQGMKDEVTAAIAKVTTVDIVRKPLNEAKKGQLIWLGGANPIPGKDYKGVDVADQNNFIDMHTLHVGQVKKFILDKEAVERQAKNLKIGFSAFNGSGNKAVPRLLKELGFSDVKVIEKLQELDGLFPAFGWGEQPDPGDPIAADTAVKEFIAEHGQGAFDALDILIGTDPDADRLGLIVKVPENQQHLFGKYRLLSANDAWTLLIWYRLMKKQELGLLSNPEKHFITLSHTTTDALEAVAKLFGVRSLGEMYDKTGKEERGGYLNGRRTWVGFTFLADFGQKKRLEGYTNEASAEESNGFSILGGLVREGEVLADDGHINEKDGTFAGILLAEVASYARDNHTNIFELLDDIYLKIGHYATANKPLPRVGSFEGAEGVTEKIKLLRKAQEWMRKANERAGSENPFELGGLKVIGSTEFKTGRYDEQHYEAFPDEGIRFFFEDSSLKEGSPFYESKRFITIRPASTSQSIRFYTQLYSKVSKDTIREQKFNNYLSAEKLALDAQKELLIAAGITKYVANVDAQLNKLLSSSPLGEKKIKKSDDILSRSDLLLRLKQVHNLVSASFQKGILLNDEETKLVNNLFYEAMQNKDPELNSTANKMLAETINFYLDEFQRQEKKVKNGDFWSVWFGLEKILGKMAWRQEEGTKDILKMIVFGLLEKYPDSEQKPGFVSQELVDAFKHSLSTSLWCREMSPTAYLIIAAAKLKGMDVFHDETEQRLFLDGMIAGLIQHFLVLSSSDYGSPEEAMASLTFAFRAIWGNELPWLIRTLESFKGNPGKELAPYFDSKWVRSDVARRIFDDIVEGARKLLPKPSDLATINNALLEKMGDRRISASPMQGIETMEKAIAKLKNDKFEDRIRSLYGASLKDAEEKDPYLASIAFDRDDKKEQNRLGWTMQNLQWLLDHPETVENVIKDAQQIRENYNNVIFCGMGGSGLSVQVVKTTFGEKETKIYSLRTTDPAVIEDMLDEIAARESGSLEKALEKTLVIPISKSGTTQETVSHKKYFEELFAKYGIDIKEHMWVITDKGSPFDTGDFIQREIQLNGRGDIGGRFTAPTTNIFLLPLAIVAPEKVWPVLKNAKVMNSLLETSGQDTFLNLGSFLFHNAANLGKNKLTMLTPDGLRDLPVWFEQLLEESSGKNGKGVALFYGEKLAEQDLKPVGENDRIFLRINTQGKGTQQELWDYLESKGYPVFQITVSNEQDIGGIMLGLQRSVAALAYLWNINFVNQPAVEGYKKETKKAEAEIKAGTLRMPEAANSAELNNVTLYYDPLIQAGILNKEDIAKVVKDLGADINDAAAVYAAIISILKNRPGFESKEIISYGRMTKGLRKVFEKARETIFTKFLKMPAKLGEGPDKNHSYHQLIEDGPDMWLSLYFMPQKNKSSKYGVEYSGDLLKAQTLGTVRALINKGRKVLLIASKGTREEAGPDLAKLFEKSAEYLKQAVSSSQVSAESSSYIPEDEEGEVSAESAITNPGGIDLGNIDVGVTPDSSPIDISGIDLSNIQGFRFRIISIQPIVNPGAIFVPFQKVEQESAGEQLAYLNN